MGATSTQLLYVSDIDSAFKQAIAAGAKQTMEVEEQFWATAQDRSKIRSAEDPLGRSCMLATHVEEVAPEDMQQRMAQMMSHGQPA